MAFKLVLCCRAGPNKVCGSQNSLPWDTAISNVNLETKEAPA